MGKNGIVLGQQELNSYTSKKEFEEKLLSANVNVKNLKKEIKYERELEFLQIELVKLQQWLTKNNKRVVIIFEGRDAAGKGGTIRRFKEHLSPRSMRVVALTKPSDIERGQWYFMRYIKELPKPGEIVFFDRSWYNRAVVEPVMGFCTKAEYDRFIHQVSEFEHMLYEDGITIVKFWFSIAKKEQLKRFESRKTNPLKQWKLSPVDVKSRSKWDEYTVYKEKMFSNTHTSYCPWVLVNADDKLNMRLESMRYVLNLFDYKGKTKERSRIYPDPNVIQRYSRSLNQLDG